MCRKLKFLKKKKLYRKDVFKVGDEVQGTCYGTGTVVETKVCQVVTVDFGEHGVKHYWVNSPETRGNNKNER